LGDSDVQGLKDGVEKLAVKIDTVVDVIADLRVLVAGEYVRKDDFDACSKTCEDRIVRVYDKLEEHKKEEAVNRWKLAGMAASLAAVAFSFVQWLFGIVGGNTH